MTQIFLINDSFPAQAVLEPPSIFEFKHAQKIKNTPRSKSSTTLTSMCKRDLVKTCVVLSVKFNHMNHDMIHAKVQKTRDGSKSGSMAELEQKRKEKDWMAEGKSGLICLDKIPTLNENWFTGLP